jgi:AraC family transcriptional regulator of adaptative response / DNA-3-methyladenine glycosylase II
MELPDRKVCYRAFQSRDARFDGLIFVGVSSTGIYCRPICPARTPKLENCTYFGSAAAAQDAGYRPCLRCRPEIAPDLASWRGTSNTVSRALALIAEGALDGGENSVDKLADRLGLGERQLRRLFLQHLGASPVSVAQTRRVLFAKQLIHDTQMPMTEVAMASGFGSLRRFNETFHDLFRRPPSALRRKSAAKDEEQKDVALRLRYRPPYDWESILSFLRTRAIPGVEVVEGERYLRTVEVDGKLGSIEVTHLPERNSLNVKIRFPDVRSLPTIVSRVRRLFDLGADIETIDDHLSTDPALAPLVAKRPGLRAPGGWDGFEIAVRAVLGQQISVIAARGLAGQLVARHGKLVPKPFRIHTDLCHAFPTADRLSSSPIGLGMPAARSLALKAVAEAAVADPNLFRPFGSIEETVLRLRTIRGIGEWTAQYIALRAVRETDAFPATDIGLLRGILAIDSQKIDSPKIGGRKIEGKKAAGNIKIAAANLLSRAEAWRPWRAYAAQHLWAADVKPLTSQLPSSN